MSLHLAAPSLRADRAPLSPNVTESSLLLARIAEALAFPNGHAPLSEALRGGHASDPAGALAGLSPADAAALRRAWGSTLEEFQSLAAERDPRLFQEGLFALGRRLEASDRLEAAGTIYAALAASDGAMAGRARAAADAMTGSGTFGARCEFLSRRLIHEAARPEMLLAMGVAGATFRLTRLAATARLSGTLRSAWALRGAANTAGFLTETLAFTGAAKLGGAAMGVRQDWSADAWYREWAGGATMLLGLRALGGLSHAAARRWAQGNGGLEIFTRAVLPHAGMLGGIYLGQRLEAYAGFRPRREGGGLADTLATYLQFQIAGRLLHGATGGRLSAWEQAMDAHAEAVARSARRLPPTGPATPSLVGLRELFGPRLQPAGAGPLGAEPLLMSSDELPGNNGAAAGIPSSFETSIGGPRSGNGSEAPAVPAPAAPEAAPKPESVPPDSHPESAIDLRATRYHLPATEYFEGLADSLSFDKLVGYARSETRAKLLGVNLRNSLLAPLDGPLEYSPYGAGLVERLRENPEAIHTLTGKWDRALVASPGTAILGLGAASTSPRHILRAEAADAIMQGKAKYFLWTAGVTANPLCVRSYFSAEQVRELEALEPRLRAEQARIWRAERFAETVRAIAPNYGFINIEDAQGKDLPIIFGILESLRGNTAIWSDDKQGTGVITAAAMLGWAELTGRLDAEQRMPHVRGIIFGAGAGAMGVYDELVNHGISPASILVTDSRGPLHIGRRDVEGDPYKVRMREGIPADVTVEDFARSADFLINLGVKETLTDDLSATEALVRSLAPNPFFGPMTNPEPGISPQMLRGVRPDAYYGSGNQVYENPVNNFTAFGYIGAGAMMARAGDVSPAMTVAAARGIFEVAKLGPPQEIRDRLPEDRREFGRYWLVPRPDDARLIVHESGAVARAAARDGLAILLGANPSPADLARFDREIEELVGFRRWFVEDMRASLREHGSDYLRGRHPRRYAPFTLRHRGEPVYEVAPEIRRDHFEYFARHLGVRAERWADLLTETGEVKPAALTEVLERLRPATEEDGPIGQTASQELRLITQLAEISPPLGLALALRRSRVRPENLAARPTVFHREAVLRTVLRLIPEARAPLEQAFTGLPVIP